MPKFIPDKQILEAAVAVIAERGFARSTTKEIADRAKINEATLFRRFSSKAKLLDAALEGELARFDGGGGAQYTGAIVEDLERIVRLYQSLMKRHGALIIVLMSESRHTPELARHLSSADALIRSVVKLVRRYQREGVLYKGNPLAAVNSLLGPIVLHALLGRTEGPSKPPRIIPTEHVRLFLEGRGQKC